MDTGVCVWAGRRQGEKALPPSLPAHTTLYSSLVRQPAYHTPLVSPPPFPSTVPLARPGVAGKGARVWHHHPPTLAHSPSPELVLWGACGKKCGHVIGKVMVCGVSISCLAFCRAGPPFLKTNTHAHAHTHLVILSSYLITGGLMTKFCFASSLVLQPRVA